MWKFPENVEIYGASGTLSDQGVARRSYPSWSLITSDTFPCLLRRFRPTSERQQLVATPQRISCNLLGCLCSAIVSHCGFSRNI